MAGREYVHTWTQGNRYFSTDDTELINTILATHDLKYGYLDVKPVLSIIEDILQLGKPLDTVQGAQVLAHSESKEKSFGSAYRINKTSGESFRSAYNDWENVKRLAYPINKISREIIYKCSAGENGQSIAVTLLNLLSHFGWDAKVVITFAAFAVSYGEFWLVEHLHTKNQLAKHVAALKHLLETMEQQEVLKKQFKDVVKLLRTVLIATHIIIKFKELYSQYITWNHSPEMVNATAHIPTTVYWIIRSILACASILLNLVDGGHDYITTTSVSWYILGLENKLSHMADHLQRELEKCNELIGLEVLRMKYVLLLISDLDLPQEELHILHLIYNQQIMRHEYEALWLPIIDHATSMSPTQESLFLELRKSMPWYSVEHPSLVDPVAIRYIREIWNFTHMTMVVVLDPQGRVSNVNALPVMWIWGSPAFPFTKQRELALWAESSWNIVLLADSIDPRITEWIKDNKFICLYGGEDIEWIRKFTAGVRTIATALHLALEMLYVGKSSPKEKIRRCHEIIDRDQLSHTFPLRDDYDYVWFFWMRMRSMWNSKLQHGMTVETDKIMQEIMNMLTYDGSEQGWAVFSRGQYEMTKCKGDILLTVLANYEKWGYKVDHPEKFVPVLEEEIAGTQPEHHCNRLILPGNTGDIPERVVCPDCGRIMDKFLIYSCCTD
ncbi:Protein SIEVE ELEMENT OCCLUSION B [Abeliophyllum distichum]|uniref:Protein SIEVE ELEMENT OCCLUSION B n=1 Tax=Abeliophyllum distichum TaxID=126358 RepID=A0ABD1U3Q4_9LAMI